MGFRLVADENVERATVEYLETHGHDVERVVDVPELGPGAEDAAIAEYARQTDRLVLTQDDDFFTELDPERTPGVLFQPDERLTPRTVGEVVDRIATHLDQADVDLEYVGERWR